MAMPTPSQTCEYLVSASPFGKRVSRVAPQACGARANQAITVDEGTRVRWYCDQHAREVARTLRYAEQSEYERPLARAYERLQREMMEQSYIPIPYIEPLPPARPPEMVGADIGRILRELYSQPLIEELDRPKPKVKPKPVIDDRPKRRKYDFEGQ